MSSPQTRLAKQQSGPRAALQVGSPRIDSAKDLDMVAHLGPTILRYRDWASCTSGLVGPTTSAP
eukprot:3786086-Pyramimonas_sp.AAC.1